MHNSPVVEFEEGPDAPHDHEHVETLVVLARQDDGVLLVAQLLALRDQPLQQVTRLREKERGPNDTLPQSQQLFLAPSLWLRQNVSGVHETVLTCLMTKASRTSILKVRLWHAYL